MIEHRTKIPANAYRMAKRFIWFGLVWLRRNSSVHLKYSVRLCWRSVFRRLWWLYTVGRCFTAFWATERHGHNSHQCHMRRMKTPKAEPAIIKPRQQYDNSHTWVQIKQMRKLQPFDKESGKERAKRSFSDWLRGSEIERANEQDKKGKKKKKNNQNDSLLIRFTTQCEMNEWIIMHRVGVCVCLP